MTRPRIAPRGVECKDCKAERERRGLPYPAYPRPAAYQGPRCASHWRQYKRLSKAGAHERRVQDVYGLKPGEYGKLYLAQGGKCAICQRATGAKKALAVDHNHRTGRARGLLCGPCNKMLGFGRDDIDFFIRAVQYLREPPAKQLGIVAIHQDNREGDDGTEV